MRIIHYTYPTARNLVPPLGAFRPNPFLGFESEIDRLFASALAGTSPESATYRFPVDFYEDKENTYVRAELPGVAKADITIEVIDDQLTVAATRKIQSGENAETLSFSRTVTIPETVQADKVTAAYDNGILTVTLPKREEAKPRKITVAVN